MEAWLSAHAIKAIARPAWADVPPAPESEVAPDSGDEAPKSQSGRRTRNSDTLRQLLRELAESLGPRDLDMIVGFAEFLKARRAARGFAHHHEHMLQERASSVAVPPSSPSGKKLDEDDGTDEPSES